MAYSNQKTNFCTAVSYPGAEESTVGTSPITLRSAGATSRYCQPELLLMLISMIYPPAEPEEPALIGLFFSKPHGIHVKATSPASVSVGAFDCTP